MRTFAAIVLGLFIGWIIEWVIDWVYWRRRAEKSSQQEELLRERVKAAEAHSADLERQLEAQKASLADLQAKLSSAEAELNQAKSQEKFETKSETVRASSAEEMPAETIAAAPAPVRSMPVKDDLVVIKGIGPVIAAMLNQAGIYTSVSERRLRMVECENPGGDDRLVGGSFAVEDFLLPPARSLNGC